jgi:prepilin-type N-terminal cleavage/methylation domain-containing protein
MNAPLPHRGLRGFTLIEMTVVIALSAVVTLGIVAFYLSAQGTWTDASSQAVAQRDGTTLLDAISTRARGAATAVIVPVAADPRNSMMVLYDKNVPPNEQARFFWDGTDSLIHYADNGPVTGDYDQGPVVQTKVLRFSCSLMPGLAIVSVDSLRLVALGGQIVTLTSSYGLSNQP